MERPVELKRTGAGSTCGCLAMVALLVAWAAPAGAQSPGPDVGGGQDHPVVSRFAGSQLIGCQQREFEAGAFYLPSKTAGYDPARELDTDSPVRTEGKLTRLVYVAPAGKTPLEIH